MTLREEAFTEFRGAETGGSWTEVTTVDFGVPVIDAPPADPFSSEA